MHPDHATAVELEDPEREGRRRALRGALVVTVSFLAIEVVGGLLSGSLALLADATHMFADVAALTLAYAAMTLASRAPTTRYTFGLYRAEILAAFVNAELLLVISGILLYQAYQRFITPQEIATGLMLGVAVCGLVANVVAVRLLHGSHRHSVNIRAAYVEVVSDLLASLGVIGASLGMAWTGWYRLDAVVCAAIGVFVLVRTVSLLLEAGHILLEGTPPGMDVAALERDIGHVPGVTEVHDLHVWTLTSGLNTATLHIRVARGDGGAALATVQRLLRERAGVEHATIQVDRGEAGTCETEELRF